VRPEPAGLEGVLLVPLETHEDDRGSFVELFRESWIEGVPPMVQANLSRSRAGVLRGLHFHREQADFWVLLSGTQFVGLYDLRSGSPTAGRKLELRMVQGDGANGLYVPPGVAHGFYAESDVELLYLVDRFFTGEDEHGIAWDDPDVGISWPSSDPILSDREPPARRDPALGTGRSYRVSRWSVWRRHHRQYFLISSRSRSLIRFFSVT
jgi:dTDP-4-dehydrorhamnose 3,5-epimerase